MCTNGGLNMGFSTQGIDLINGTVLSEKTSYGQVQAIVEIGY